MSDTPRPATPDEISAVCKAIVRHNVSLFGGQSSQSLMTDLLKGDGMMPSAQGSSVGLRGHPFDRTKVKDLKLINSYHSNCITTKVAATVGLGFLSEEERKARNAQEQTKLSPAAQMGAGVNPLALDLSGSSWKSSKVDEVLNPLCLHSWQDTISPVCEDYHECGEGYIEVVRANPGEFGRGPITGLYYIPAETIWLNIEDNNYNRHYEVINGEGAGFSRRFALFGDAAGFRTRMTSNGRGFALASAPTSEVIVIRRPSNLSRHYGFPDWLAATPPIELMQSLAQWNYDFFKNRGVPELMLWIIGVKLLDNDWKKITDTMESGVGLGNSHKSFAMNISAPADTVTVQVDKLGMEGKENNDQSANEGNALAIVSAHGVPPLLAGILIPGKLGATNELPNALRAFQALRAGPSQRVFHTTLGATLGSPLLNGGLGLTVEDFTLRRITDEIDMIQMDTSTQMRQTEVAASAEGRDMGRGVKS